MPRSSKPSPRHRASNPRDRRDRRDRGDRRDAGHEAVGQALLLSIGLAGMLAAGRLAEVSVQGMTALMEAMQRLA